MQPIEKQALLRSLLITGSISLLFSFASIPVGLIWGVKAGVQSFTSIFICSSIAQIFSGFYKSIKMEEKEKETAKEVADRISTTILNNPTIFRVPIQLSCAYCNTINKVPISLIEDNAFHCTTCNQTNSVLIQFTTARVTQPLAPTAPNIDVEGETVRQTTINQPITVN